MTLVGKRKIDHALSTRTLFTELPKAETVDAIEALLPGNLDKDQIRIG